MDISGDILTHALAAATICKVIVDMLRQARPLPGWSAPLLALLVGILAAGLLAIATDQPMDAPAVARVILAGILAAGSAVGVTELQKRTL